MIIIIVTIHRKDRREKPFREKKKKECSATSAFARGESPPTGGRFSAVKNVAE